MGRWGVCPPYLRRGKVKCLVGAVKWAAHWTGHFGLRGPVHRVVGRFDFPPSGPSSGPGITGGLLLGRRCGWAPLPWFSDGASLNGCVVSAPLVLLLVRLLVSSLVINKVSLKTRRLPDLGSGSVRMQGVLICDVTLAPRLVFVGRLEFCPGRRQGLVALVAAPVMPTPLVVSVVGSSLVLSRCASHGRGMRALSVD